MKKLSIVMGIILVYSAMCIVVFAGSVYFRNVATLGATTGTVTWTNDSDYAAMILKKVTFYSSSDAGATLTVSRVTSDSTYTQAVCTIVGAGANSNATSFTTSYLADGDKLVLSSSTATSGVVMIEGEYQKH